MADSVGAASRGLIALVLCLTVVFGAVYGTLIGVGLRDDHPSWVSAGAVGIVFTGMVVVSILVWILSDLCFDHWIDNKAFGAFMLTASTVLLAGTAVAVWLVVKGATTDSPRLLGGGICALVHLVILDIAIIGVTGVWLSSFCRESTTGV